MTVPLQNEANRAVETRARRPSQNEPNSPCGHVRPSTTRSETPPEKRIQRPVSDPRSHAPAWECRPRRSASSSIAAAEPPRPNPHGPPWERGYEISTGRNEPIPAVAVECAGAERTQFGRVGWSEQSPHAQVMCGRREWPRSAPGRPTRLPATRCAPFVPCSDGEPRNQTNPLAPWEVGRHLEGWAVGVEAVRGSRHRPGMG